MGRGSLGIMKKNTLDSVSELSNKGLGYRKISDLLGISERQVRNTLQEIKKRAAQSNANVIMGDPHADPDEPNTRFKAANSFLRDRLPSRIICMGDFGDMNSLNSYEKGKKSMEGKRYRKDIAAVIEAQELLLNGIEDIPHTMLYGNHENRILRACNEDPKLDGTLSLSDLKFEEFGWETHKYGKVVMIDGVAYTHHFNNGRFDKPIGGEHQASAILRHKKMNSVQGHSHIFDYKEGTRGNGEPIFALVAGCFFQKEVSYVTNQETPNWWRGLIVMTPYINDNGFQAWDIEKVSIERLMDKYL